MKTKKTQSKSQTSRKTKEARSRGASDKAQSTNPPALHPTPVNKLADTPTEKKATKAPVNLYWVTTDDDSENWFIFARRRRSAESYHENYEGYNAHDATARTILTNVQLAEYEAGPPPCHARIKDLQALGFEILDRPEYERAVRFRGELFFEGGMEAIVRELWDNQLEAAGEGRPNGTKPSMRN